VTRVAALGALALALAACHGRSPHVYRMQPPVDGIAIAPTDWTDCDKDADRAAFAVGEQTGVTVVGFGALGAIVSAAARPDPAVQAEHREQSYDRAMRACLVNRGYAVTVPLPPDTGFGGRP
jgi:hypothetical protein